MVERSAVQLASQSAISHTASRLSTGRARTARQPDECVSASRLTSRQLHSSPCLLVRHELDGCCWRRSESAGSAAGCVCGAQQAHQQQQQEAHAQANTSRMHKHLAPYHRTKQKEPGAHSVSTEHRQGTGVDPESRAGGMNLRRGDVRRRRLTTSLLCGCCCSRVRVLQLGCRRECGGGHFG